MATRHDVLLFGPTGVTGREVARHLARRAPELGLSWAVAGRDRSRMEAVLHGLGATPDAILEADTEDAASIDTMAASAAVVANLVGPYARHGEVVYDACIRHGTHQLDLNGELDWLARMLDVYQGRALEQGARIVPTAGFEALPFDLATRLAADTVHQRSGQPVVEVDVAVTMTSQPTVLRPADAVSGGTFSSIVGEIRRGAGEAFTDPFLLDPPDSARSGRYDLRPRRHRGTGAWLGPLVPSPFLNPPVVHRSAALLRRDGDPTFAPGFRYREGMDVGAMVPGPGAPVAAATLSALQVGVGLAAKAPGFLRRPMADVLARVGPSSGDGPKPEDLDRWAYRLDVWATTTGGATAGATVEAVGHPGYKSTATMVAEAALILADPDAPVPDRAGFLTPSTALGIDVLDRFSKAAATFSLRHEG